MSLWLPLACTSRSKGSKDPNKIGVALLGLGSYAGGQLAPVLISIISITCGCRTL